MIFCILIIGGCAKFENDDALTNLPRLNGSTPDATYIDLNPDLMNPQVETLGNPFVPSDIFLWGFPSDQITLEDYWQGPNGFPGGKIYIRFDLNSSHQMPKLEVNGAKIESLSGIYEELGSGGPYIYSWDFVPAIGLNTVVVSVKDAEGTQHQYEWGFIIVDS